MTPHQLALRKKAADSLQAAQLLAEQKFYDFAISRAYYTMFYIAQAFLLGEGFTTSKHSTVISLFGQHFAKTKRVPTKFHRYLIEAQSSRIAGDYSIQPSLSALQAETHINRAKEFLELGEQLIGPTPSSETDKS